MGNVIALAALIFLVLLFLAAFYPSKDIPKNKRIARGVHSVEHYYDRSDSHPHTHRKKLEKIPGKKDVIEDRPLSKAERNVLSNK